MVGANLYASNATNGTVGTNSILVPTGAPIFRDPAALNFYPISGGLVIGATVTNGGSGYTSAPTVVFSGGGGAGAAGTAVLGPPVATGSVTSVSVTSGGNGYTSAPAVSFTGAYSLRPQTRSARGKSSALQGPGPTVMMTLRVMPFTMSVTVRV